MMSCDLSNDICFPCWCRIEKEEAEEREAEVKREDRS